ncbi:MAG: TAXI family TRAP transporter solute-binding subunit [Pseudomonadota bacterium]
MTKLIMTVLALCALFPNLLAAEGKLPRTLTWSAYDTASSGYAQAVAMGNMMKRKHNVSIRVIPGKNDISRMTPLKMGRIDYCACGIATYFAQEGVSLFTQPKWGPQPFRVLLMSNGRAGLGVGSTDAAEIKMSADLKGKRVAWVRSGDALNIGIQAILAHGGLTWDDVIKVEFGGYKASLDGLINNQVDAAFMSTMTPQAQRLHAGPRGFSWALMPHDDKEAWARAQAVAPYFQPMMGTQGPGHTEETPWEGGGYPYPILVSNLDKPEEEVYLLVKALVEGFKDYEKGAPGSDGWALDRQSLSWVIPFHDGAIRYFKEIGKWTDEHQANPEKLLERQAVLAETWQSFTASKPAKADYKEKWPALRASALREAGFIPAFE